MNEDSIMWSGGVVTSTNDGLGVGNAIDRFSVCRGKEEIDVDSKGNTASVLVVVCTIVEDTWISKDGRM